MSDDKIKGAAPDQENAPFKYIKQQNTKEMSILEELRTGRSLNRFEAERLGDHCLHSTISTLRSKGYRFTTNGSEFPHASIKKCASSDIAMLG